MHKYIFKRKNKNQQDTQSIGIHDVLQWFAKHYRAISNTVSFLRIFRCGGIFYSKGRGWIDFFSYFGCFRSKDLPIKLSGRAQCLRKCPLFIVNKQKCSSLCTAVRSPQKKSEEQTAVHRLKCSRHFGN